MDSIIDFVDRAAKLGRNDPDEVYAICNKGQALYAFVTLKEGIAESDELKKELIVHVRKEIGPIAAPDKLQFAPGLPKTRSGKIMRRILRKIAEDQPEAIGDTTTLADPHVVEVLVEGRQ